MSEQKTDFDFAHDYFKRVFSGNDPMKKTPDIKNYPDINKLLIVTTKQKASRTNGRKNIRTI